MNEQNSEEKQERLASYLKRNEYPFNYEEQLITDNGGTLDNILAGKISEPLHFEFLPTEQCNLNCVWCRGGHRNSLSSSNMLSEDITLRLIDELADYHVGGIIRFAGMSGEPLLNPATVKGIRQGVKRGLKMGLITNGVFLTSEIYDSLRGSTYISVSLDSGTNQTFNRLKNNHRLREDTTFEIILKNIASLAEFKRVNNEQFRFTIGYLVQHDNFKEMALAAKLVKSAGADILQFKIPYLGIEERFSEEEINQFNQVLKEALDYSDSNFRVMPMQTNQEINLELRGNKPQANFSRCYAHNLNGVVGADGNLYVCVHYFYNSKTIAGEPIGNIYCQSFKDIWESEKRKSLTASICPKMHCQFCNRYDTRINRFINFLSEDNLLKERVAVS